MRILSLVAASALLTLPSCYQFEVTAQAGYALLSLDGDFGYVDGSSSATIDQDIESAFGLGDDQGTPYAKLAFDFGTPTLSVSGFMFEDEGTGTLSAPFGANLPSGFPVRSEFDLTCAKVAYAFEIPIGPISISPGLAVDYVDLDFLVADQFGATTEEAQLQAPLPMLFLRAEADISIVTLLVEAGYVSVDIDDIEAQLLDVEALVEINATTWLNFFAGYRMIDFEADGLIDNDTYDIDLGLSGFLVGGGFRF